MKKKSNHYLFLNNVIIGMLIFNIFIFTSIMPFLPWFMEDGDGYMGLLLTSFVLLMTFFKSYQLHKNGERTILQTSIPLVSAMFSFFSMLTLIDFINIFCLIVNVGILIICLISFGKNSN
ncbi:MULTISPECIES: hypothetical protein [Bacillus cereus group]|uniref:Group-specific protein n=2 Tax=Bacillus cereus group TaxID=86661 RepID=A0A2A8PU77_BACCE|nr:MULTISPECIES: hypothetical protein [Bacillus cereus group]EJS66812.1 hypothetical protein ICY_04856 [Bacillus cereus BAG2X1-3]MCQ6358842.1 hypothetical protein [Bacillus cereus]PEA06821.1 hypothetical protein CON38_25905 [Bacillus cereus]PEV99783.1 hypothetical protein CN425_18620 [Bacillus cereus]SCB69145.1 Uncharacterized protein BWGO95_03297 [Bacillus mycoides]